MKRRNRIDGKAHQSAFLPTKVGFGMIPHHKHNWNAYGMEKGLDGLWDMGF